MGSFVGHIDEALFFLLISFWWMFRIFPLYIRNKRLGKPFKAQLSYRLRCGKNLPLEAIFKLLFPLAGLVGELFSQGFALVGEDGRFRKLAQMQHMSIYCIFILHSALDLLTTFHFPVPPKINYLSAALSFFWYGMSFSYHAHMHGKQQLENTFHLLPISTMYLTAIVALLEMTLPFLFQLVLLRIACLLVLGTWFTQAAFVLYLPYPWPGSNFNPSWNQSDPHNVHAIVASFGFHIIFAIVLITVVFSATHLYLSRFTHLPNIHPVSKRRGNDGEEDNDEDAEVKGVYRCLKSESALDALSEDESF